jgi:hypothetical protein
LAELPLNLLRRRTLTGAHGKEKAAGNSRRLKDSVIFADLNQSLALIVHAGMPISRPRVGVPPPKTDGFGWFLER